MNLLLNLAVLPGIVLIYMVYREDKVEKEPAGLLVKLAVLGMVAIVPAMIIELILDGVLGSFAPETSMLYIVLDCFVVVATAEEGMKYLLLKKGSWKHPAFDFCFDGIIYAVCVSGGFAILENIMYVLDYGLGTALVRAVTAIPGHITFGIFMGLYYGQAKLCAGYGDIEGEKRCRRKAFWVPWLLHGLYDTLASTESGLGSLLFLIFIIVLDIYAIRRVRSASVSDQQV